MLQNIGEKYFTGRSGKKSAYENAGGRAQKFLKLTERHAAFTDLTPAILNEFISRIEVHERDQKRARYVTNADPGSGLLFFQNVILPFKDEFPKDTELYKLLTTKPSEVAHDGQPG